MNRTSPVEIRIQAVSPESIVAVSTAAAEATSDSWAASRGEPASVTNMNATKKNPTRVRDNSVSELIPGIGAVYRVGEDWRLLAGVHKGYNPPAPGSSASAETSLNVEVGTRFDSDSVSFEGIFFVNDYDNLVGTVTDSTGGGGVIGDQFDGGEVVVQGVELSVSSHWETGDIGFPVSLNYTWTSEAEFENSFESDFDPWGDVLQGDELPYIPEHLLRAMAGVEHDRFTVNVAANYVGKMRTEAGQGGFDPATTVDSHVVWDLVGTWEFTGRLSAYVKVDNLFDETYVAARRPAGVRPGLPRTAYLGIRYSH